MGKHVIEYVIKATDATSKAVSSAASGVRGLSSKIRHALSEAGCHFGSFAKTVGSNLMNIKAGLDMAVGFVQRFVGTFTGAIREAFRFETAVANFKTLLGSIDAAKEHIEELRKFAAATPLTFDDLAAASKLMLSFGIAVKDIMPNLKMLGDISMGNAVKFQGLALVFSQIKAAGRLMGQDLLQMINQGFNPLTIIAEKTGASMVELKKLMEDGAISFEMVEEAMRTATGEGGRFNNAMKDCATTGEGLMSTLQDNWTDAVRTFGNELLDVAKGGIQWCINKIQELKESGAIQEWAEKAKTSIYAVIGAFNGMADASSRAKVWGALKDVLIGGFEEAATGAAKILIKAAKVVGSVIQKGLELTVKDFAIGQSAEKDVFNKWKKQGRVKAAGLNLLGNDEFKADVEKQKQHIKDTLMRQETERAKKAAGFGDERGTAGESRLDRALRILSEFGNQAVKAANEMNATPVVSQPTAEASKPKDLKAMLEDARGKKSGGTLSKEAQMAALDAEEAEIRAAGKRDELAAEVAKKRGILTKRLADESSVATDERQRQQAYERFQHGNDEIALEEEGNKKLVEIEGRKAKRVRQFATDLAGAGSEDEVKKLREQYAIDMKKIANEELKAVAEVKAAKKKAEEAEKVYANRRRKEVRDQIEDERKRHKQALENFDDEIRKAKEKAAKWKEASDEAVAFARGDRQTDRGKSGFSGWRNEEREKEKAEKKAKGKSDREMARNDSEIERLQKEAKRGKAFNTPQLQKELAQRIKFRDLQDPTKNPGKKDLAALEEKKTAAIEKMKDGIETIVDSLKDLGV